LNLIKVCASVRGSPIPAGHEALQLNLVAGHLDEQGEPTVGGEGLRMPGNVFHVLVPGYRPESGPGAVPATVRVPEHGRVLP